MSDEPGALSLRASPPTEADYDKIYNAVMETERGRWFLVEYAKRNRNADTTLLLAAIDRIEATLRFQKAAALASPQPLSALQPELEDLKAAIARTRESLSAIGPDGALAGKAPDFSDIAQALERVSVQVRAAAGHMLEAGSAAPEPVRFEIESQTADIAESCLTIEHLAGQSQKLAMLLRTIEDRIDLFLSHAEAPRSEPAAASDAQREEQPRAQAGQVGPTPAEDSEEARAIEAGPEWAPPIIQTNGSAPAFVEPALAPAAPIKGPSGWLSKLAPVVSYTARFSGETPTPPAQRAPASEPDAEKTASVTPLRPTQIVDRAAMREKIASRTASIFDAYFPASDSFKFDTSAMPAEEPSAPHSAAEDKTEPEIAAPKPDAERPVFAAPSDRADAESEPADPVPPAIEEPAEEPVAAVADQTDLADLAALAEAIGGANPEAAAHERVAEIPEEAAAEAPAPDDQPSVEEHSFSSMSLMEALEREIAAPWPDLPPAAETADAIAPQSAAPAEPASHEPLVEAKAEEPAGRLGMGVSAETEAAALPAESVSREDEPSRELAALEAALESFTTSVFENRYAKGEAANASPANSALSPPVVDHGSSSSSPAVSPLVETVPASDLRAPAEQRSGGLRVAGGSPTRGARRPAQARDDGKTDGIGIELASIPERWLNDVLFEARPKETQSAAEAATPEVTVDAGMRVAPQAADGSTASAQQTAAPETLEAAAMDAAFAPANAPVVAEASASTIAQGGSVTVVNRTISRAAVQAAAAIQASAGSARQGGAAPVRRPVPPPLSPVYGARGFRADRPGGNGRSGAARLGDAPAAETGAEQNAAAKANDPLTPVMALSEEERIALFS